MLDPKDQTLAMPVRSWRAGEYAWWLSTSGYMAPMHVEIVEPQLDGASVWYRIRATAPNGPTSLTPPYALFETERDAQFFQNIVEPMVDMIVGADMTTATQLQQRALRAVQQLAVGRRLMWQFRDRCHSLRWDNERAVAGLQAIQGMAQRVSLEVGEIIERLQREDAVLKDQA